MKLTEICRESNSVIEFTEPLSALALEAEAVLGYSRLKQEQQKTEEDKSTLLSKLTAIQIDVLRVADVLKYKQETLVDHTRAKFEEWSKAVGQSQFWGPGWQRQKIAEYTQPIPEFVLNKAIQIKRAIPDALIFIESLQEHPDPFLVIATPHPKYDCLTEEEHYVEVWEEPKFEGRIR